jgi:hypothetical protein
MQLVFEYKRERTIKDTEKLTLEAKEQFFFILLTYPKKNL